MLYDVTVIGAGVTGAMIARELSKYDLNICLVEGKSDVAAGASSANSGIIHSGYDAEIGSLKAKLNVLGVELMEQVAGELCVPYKKTGSLLLAFNEEDKVKVSELYERGIKNGVRGLQIINGEQTRNLEHNVSQDVVMALHAPTAGIICPYELTLGSVENAVENGVELKLDCKVLGINTTPSDCTSEYSDSGKRSGITNQFMKPYFELYTSKGIIKSRFVVNAAGVYADEIASMAGDPFFKIHPRKGEYLLLDKSQGKTVNSVIFQTPTKAGKGILVTPTVDGNLLIGPNAVENCDKEDTSTNAAGLEQVRQGALKSVPSIETQEVIASFAGLRATSDKGDFIIGESGRLKNFINAAGIESPGLTASPAIAVQIVKILADCGLELAPKKNFNPVRSNTVHFAVMSKEEREAMVRQNPGYGRVVCRCETVTEAEIIEAIRRPAGARNLDGIKRRTRAGMGRCQGGFCTPRIVEILSRELGIPMEDITKFGGSSRILSEKTK